MTTNQAENPEIKEMISLLETCVMNAQLCLGKIRFADTQKSGNCIGLAGLMAKVVSS
ncbi:MAG: hypothetical protein OXC82_05005 [Rhodobacteraceae bacterium]|nr:hypothetical protein [Paracoccaceae bacterium]MCY4249780.1 hypothetical protein [Paracoccaceae bacterium]MCY4308591.1 hypothetical protein [Paracoccaceae bacterium]